MTYRYMPVYPGDALYILSSFTDGVFKCMFPQRDLYQAMQLLVMGYLTIFKLL